MENEKDLCSNLLPYIELITGGIDIYDIRQNSADQDPDYFVGYLNSFDVQKSLNLPSYRAYSTHNSTVGKALRKDKLNDTLPIINTLLPQIKILIHSGQFDLFDGPVGIQEWMKKIQWDDIPAFNQAPRWLYKFKDSAGDVQVGGWVKQFGNLI